METDRETNISVLDANDIETGLYVERNFPRKQEYENPTIRSRVM